MSAAAASSGLFALRNSSASRRCAIPADGVSPQSVMTLRNSSGVFAPASASSEPRRFRYSMNWNAPQTPTARKANVTIRMISFPYWIQKASRSNSSAGAGVGAALGAAGFGSSESESGCDIGAGNFQTHRKLQACRASHFASVPVTPEQSAKLKALVRILNFEL